MLLISLVYFFSALFFAFSNPRMVKGMPYVSPEWIKVLKNASVAVIVLSFVVINFSLLNMLVYALFKDSTTITLLLRAATVNLAYLVVIIYLIAINPFLNPKIDNVNPKLQRILLSLSGMVFFIGYVFVISPNTIYLERIGYEALRKETDQLTEQFKNEVRQR
ncbi:MAG: hypothetical protein AAGF07_02580 [Patescibacteria group bacterium]